MMKKFQWQHAIGRRQADTAFQNAYINCSGKDCPICGETLLTWIVLLALVPNIGDNIFKWMQIFFNETFLLIIITHAPLFRGGEDHVCESPLGDSCFVMNIHNPFWLQFHCGLFLGVGAIIWITDGTVHQRAYASLQRPNAIAILSGNGSTDLNESCALIDQKFGDSVAVAIQGGGPRWDTR